MNLRITSTLMATVFALSLGCSAKLEDVSPNLSPDSKKGFSKASITGPDVEGVWSSQCVSEISYLGNYRQIGIEFKGSTFHYVSSRFDDVGCKSLVSKTEKSGDFQFSEKVSDTVYTIDYQHKKDNVTYFYEGEKLAIEGESLYLSGLSYGTAVLDRTLPLHRDLQSKP